MVMPKGYRYYRALPHFIKWTVLVTHYIHVHRIKVRIVNSLTKSRLHIYSKFRKYYVCDVKILRLVAQGFIFAKHRPILCCCMQNNTLVNILNLQKAMSSAHFSPSNWNSCSKRYYNNWAVAWYFQQFEILTCVDLDEPLQTAFKLKNSKWCSVSSLTIIEYSRD